MKMVWMDDPVEVNKDMQLPQYIYTKHKLFDCSVNYTGGDIMQTSCHVKSFGSKPSGEKF